MNYLLAGARVPHPTWLQEWAKLSLPAWHQWFKQSRVQQRYQQSALCWSQADEVAMAAHLGWLSGLPAALDANHTSQSSADGCFPWAAWAQRSDQPCAWVRLCHWQLGRDAAAMGNPSDLALTEAESEALMTRMAPYFFEDGLKLTHHLPGLWWCEGPLMVAMGRSASMSRVVGRDVGPWVDTLSATAPLRRLQSEMQMLLYNDPVNETRSQKGQLPVNAIWFSGAGATTAQQRHSAQTAPPMMVDRAFEEALLANDMNAWLQHWLILERTLVPGWLQTTEGAAAVTVTLAGRDSYLTLQTQKLSALRRWLAHLLSPRAADCLLESPQDEPA